MSELATREILWNIPHFFKIIMYIFFLSSLAIFAIGVNKKIELITNGMGLKSLKAILPTKLNWDKLWQTLLLQGKVPRVKYVGAFHALIFYGFFILWIATDLVAVHYDTPLKIFQGTTYIVVSFLADLAGIMVLLGIMIAYKRRYIDKPEYLSATKPSSEKFMYFTLINLVVVGYLLEAIRILGNHFPAGEYYWSPVGSTLATLIQFFPISDSLWAYSYRILWFLHMTATMVFVASIPYTKFAHILFAPINALITPAYRGAVLNPMNFEDENAETFGLSKQSELTMKQRLDLLACVECGRCTNVCPAKAADKPLNPKLIVTKMRDFIFKDKKVNDGLFWDAEDPTKSLYQSNELDSCTTCGACMEECPMNIEHVQLITDLKRYKVLTLGDIPAAAGDAVSKIKKNGNPWGISQDDRFKWADGLNVPVIELGKEVDYLYYVGCAGSYDPSNQKVVKDTISLLKKADVKFAVLGKSEKCNGDPIRRFGDEYSFFEVAIENISNLKQYKFKKIVTHCPHCLHTIGKEYAKYEDGKFEVIHHSELLSELISSGHLKPSKEINEEITLHDPCYLGRHHGEYDAPRDILSSIPGLKVKEMEKSKDTSRCCGMGGGNMWYELPEGHHLAHNRLHDIAETKVNKLASACSFCMINFNSSKGHVKETESLVVEDVASLLAKSIE